MEIDEIIVWLNIASMSACAVLIGTWSRVAIGVFKEDRTRIHHIAMGLCLVAFGIFTIRGYSLIMREFNILWIRDSYLAVWAVLLKTIGVCYLAGSYFSSSRQIDLTPKHRTGLYAGIVVFLVLSMIPILH